VSSFFEHPILNSPYEYPFRHWELDEQRQPTNQVIEKRRPADFITPVPRPKKQKASPKQQELGLDEGLGLSTEKQKYDLKGLINEVRANVDAWRNLSPNQWQVTPETARLLEHWRHHQFDNIRPFFCQVEAVETAIWLTEVAPHLAAGKRFLQHLENANRDANPLLQRLALKLATGAGKTTVMAMLIAWQTVNAVRRPGSKVDARAPYLWVYLKLDRPARTEVAERLRADADSSWLDPEVKDRQPLGRYLAKGDSERVALADDPKALAAFVIGQLPQLVAFESRIDAALKASGLLG
jgi:hypothetical protein